MQGIGVSLPCAAAVAEPVGGKETVRHRPKGRILYMETWSEMFPMGFPVMKTVRSGYTINLELPVPKVHFIVAVETT